AVVPPMKTSCPVERSNRERKRRGSPAGTPAMRPQRCREERSPRVPQDPGASATRLKRAALALRAERGAVAGLVFARQPHGSPPAPAARRSAAPFPPELRVGGMQNPARGVGFPGTFVSTWPAAEPFSLIWRQVVLPKQPTWVPASWPVQNRPTELVVLAGPVV